MATKVKSRCRRTWVAPTRARRVESSRSAALRSLTESWTTTSRLDAGAAGGAASLCPREAAPGKASLAVVFWRAPRSAGGDGDGRGTALLGPRSADRPATSGRRVCATGGTALGRAGDEGETDGSGGPGSRGS